MITDSYSLEAPAHILHETCFLECVYTPGEIHREVRIMKVLGQMYRGVERRIAFRILFTYDQQVRFPVCIVSIVSFYAQTCREQPVISLGHLRTENRP